MWFIYYMWLLHTLISFSVDPACFSVQIYSNSFLTILIHVVLVCNNTQVYLKKQQQPTHVNHYCMAHMDKEGRKRQQPNVVHKLPVDKYLPSYWGRITNTSMQTSRKELAGWKFIHSLSPPLDMHHRLLPSNFVQAFWLVKCVHIHDSLRQLIIGDNIGIIWDSCCHWGQHWEGVYCFSVLVQLPGDIWLSIMGRENGLNGPLFGHHWGPHLYSLDLR